MRRQPAIRFLNENSEEAVIEIYGQIGYEGWDREDDENTARLMSGELDRIKALNAKRITVKINSLGGDVNHALAIHDLLAEHPALVTTQINGLCASAATIVAMAGKERRMSKNALFLIHQCSAYVGRANQEQLAQELETQKTVNGRMLDIYTAACNGKEAEISELLKANNGLGKWLTATEAKDFGFVTDIYNESRKTACFTQSAFSDNGLPALPEAYADMVAAEDTRSPWQSLVDLLTKHFSGNDNPQNQTLTDMKKLFPLLAVALALQDTAAYDPEKGASLTDTQLKAIEGKLTELDTLLKEREALVKEKQALVDEKATLTAQLAALTADRDRLKGIVDAVPAETPAVSGGDPQEAPKDNMQAYVNGSSLYQAIKREI
jgi:Protease subunit of ATP-dependent Clp proteases